ncbi:MAG: hemerythrin domain-containing protein [Planctomycetes bacterium]|nr:hemerythrin domain-containing protein [Planctomycetota bacterium]
MNIPVLTISDFFRSDHGEIDALYKSALQSARAGDAAAAIRSFKEYDRRLERHIEWEEKLLFPAFEVAIGESGGCGGPTRAMLEEHRQIRELKSTLGARIAELKAPPAANDPIFTIASALGATLREHNDKEEQILYPMCDDAVSAAAKDAILKEVTGNGGQSNA